MLRENSESGLSEGHGNDSARERRVFARVLGSDGFSARLCCHQRGDHGPCSGADAQILCLASGYSSRSCGVRYRLFGSGHFKIGLV